MNVYLTGSTGFLGKQIARDLSKRETGKLYLPIRKKHGRSGSERFDSLFSDLSRTSRTFRRTFFVNNVPEDTPKDTDCVIFNAFSLNFESTLYDVVFENVRPIIETIKYTQNQRTVKKIIVISTAYLKRPGVERTELPDFDALSMYEGILEKRISWESIKPLFHPHFTFNTYIFAKLLMEKICTLMIKKGLTIIRPSQICISTDGEYGTCNVAMAGCRFHCSPMMCVYISKYPMDIVPVDALSDLIVNSMTDSRDVIYGTSGSRVTALDLSNLVSPDKYNVHVESKNILYYLIYWTENIVYKTLTTIGAMNPRQYKAWRGFHKNYSYFQLHHWIFPDEIKIDEQAYLGTINTYCDRWKRVKLNANL